MYYKISPNLVRDVARTFLFLTSQNARHKSSLISHKSFTEYESFIPTIFNRIQGESLPKDILDNVNKISEYSLKREENIAGPLTILAYENLEKSPTITDESLNQIRTLAWSAEMVHSYFLILNDIEAYGTRSKGHTLWQLYDASLLRSILYEVLKTNFSRQSTYADLVQLFDKAFLHTAVGYQLDSMSKQRKDYNNYNVERFNLITDFKNFHIFNFPIQLALKMSHNDDLYSYHQVVNICTDLGRLHQMQSDYLNCYAESTEQPGLPAHSKDIQQGRCSWLFVSAFRRCNSAQRIVLRACYGSTEPSHVERVKLLYDQLQMPKVYNEEWERMSTGIINKSKKLNNKLYADVFQSIVEDLKNRQS